jgi:uncharacterized protein (TIGR02453 family)
MIETASLEFLDQLIQNNDREWFNKNKARYEKARENVLDFTSQVIKGLAEFDPTIPKDLNPKDCVMRIYRDIRFSNDKTPFKTNFGIAISANGKNFNGPGYYVHIQPQVSFAAGGAWYPEAEQLKAIRQEIDYSSGEFLKIVTDPAFKSVFEQLDQEGALKTSPKGYPANHELIKYLRLKSFSASAPLSDKELCKSDSVKTITSKLEKIYPLMVFLRGAIS